MSLILQVESQPYTIHYLVNHCLCWPWISGVFSARWISFLGKKRQQLYFGVLFPQIYSHHNYSELHFFFFLPYDDFYFFHYSCFTVFCQLSTIQQGDPVTIHVYILFSHIIMLHHKWLYSYPPLNIRSISPSVYVIYPQIMYIWNIKYIRSKIPSKQKQQKSHSKTNKKHTNQTCGYQSQRVGEGQLEEVDQKVQTSSYKINIRDVNVQHHIYRWLCYMIDMNIVKRVNPGSSCHKEKILFSMPFLFLVSVWEDYYLNLL